MWGLSFSCVVTFGLETVIIPRFCACVRVWLCEVVVDVEGFATTTLWMSRQVASEVVVCAACLMDYYFYAGAAMRVEGCVSVVVKLFLVTSTSHGVVSCGLFWFQGDVSGLFAAVL